MRTKSSYEYDLLGEMNLELVLPQMASERSGLIYTKDNKERGYCRPVLDADWWWLSYTFQTTTAIRRKRLLLRLLIILMVPGCLGHTKPV
jgi:hypothetical protein